MGFNSVFKGLNYIPDKISDLCPLSPFCVCVNSHGTNSCYNVTTCTFLNRSEWLASTRVLEPMDVYILLRSW